MRGCRWGLGGGLGGGVGLDGGLVSLGLGGGTSGLMRAGMLANSGLEAKAVRLSTASMSGPVAARQRSRFSWLKAPSRACRRSRGQGESWTCVSSGGAEGDEP